MTPALIICRGCGSEIGQDRRYGPGGKIILLPLPRTCPYCDEILDLQLRDYRPKYPGQKTLSGVC